VFAFIDDKAGFKSGFAPYLAETKRKVEQLQPPAERVERAWRESCSTLLEPLKMGNLRNLTLRNSATPQYLSTRS